MRTSSLDIQEEKNKEDQDNRLLKFQMDDAHKAIKSLAMELAELQKFVKRIFFSSNYSVISSSGNRISYAKTTSEFPANSFFAIAIERLNFVF